MGKEHKEHEALEWFWKHLDELDEQDKLAAAAEQDKLTAAAHPWVLNGVFKTVPYSVTLAAFATASGASDELHSTGKVMSH